MPQATVTTAGVTLVAADPDNARRVIVQNTDITNYIEIEIGSIPAAGTGYIIPKATAANVPLQGQPWMTLPPNTSIGARANTASCDVRYLIS